jgi:hypothetical protein
MSPKRLDRVPPPALEGEWEVRFGTSEAAKGWDELCAQAPTNTRAAFELMRVNPRPPQDKSHYELRGGLSTRTFKGRTLEQWQVKVTSSGRIWYLPDDQARTVWVVYASPAHPRETE